MITGIFKPAADLVDNVHTSTEEKMALKNKLAEIENHMQEEFFKLQSQLIEASSKQAIAEISSDSWLVKNYRAIIILGLFALICCESFGLLHVKLPEMFWQIFAGAFGVMSAAPQLLDVLKKGKK